MNITWALLMMALGGVGVPHGGHDSDVTAALQSATNPPSSQSTAAIQTEHRHHQTPQAAPHPLLRLQAFHPEMKQEVLTTRFLPIRSRMPPRLKVFM